MPDPTFEVTFKITDKGEHLNSFEDYERCIKFGLKDGLEGGGLKVSEIKIKEIK